MVRAKANAVEPFAYLREVLVCRSGELPRDLFKLLPDEWLKSHPDVRSRYSR